MTTKFGFQALALAGILAVSGLPAFAADMNAAGAVTTPAIHSDANTSAKLPAAAASTSVKTKADANVSKDKVSKDKTVAKTSKDVKKVHEQTAKLPASAPAISSAPAASVPSSSIPAPAASTNLKSSTGATVGH